MFLYQEQIIEGRTQELHKGIYFTIIAILPSNLLLWKLKFQEEQL